MTALLLDNTFEDNDLIEFITEISLQLYNVIKDDYIPNQLDDFSVQSDKIRYATHKLNVLLDFCRDSLSIKKLSSSFIVSPNNNNQLYKRYITTLFSIYVEYLQILHAHPNYELHKSKILNLYSGMKSINTDGTNILIKHPISTTLRPIQYYAKEPESIYINFKCNLDNLIIPIIGNCYIKFYEMTEDRSYATSGEYEFLYFGHCDVPLIDEGIVITSFRMNYDIYKRMYPKPKINIYKLRSFLNLANIKSSLKDYIIDYGDVNILLQIIINNYFLDVDKSIISTNKTLLEILISIVSIKNSIYDDDTFNDFIWNFTYILKYWLKFNTIQLTDYSNTGIYNITSAISKLFNNSYIIKNTPNVKFYTIEPKCTDKSSLIKIIQSGENINYMNKYQKYKNKYLKLKQMKQI
jgi:hypothetical protein